MAKIAGKDSALWWATLDLSPYLTSINMSADGETYDVTTLGQNFIQKIAGRKDVSLDCEGVYEQAAGSALMADLTSGTAKAYKYFPQGSVSTRDVFSGTAFVASMEVPAPGDGAVTFSIAFASSGTITVGTVA